jgi:hypothetical protein
MRLEWVEIRDLQAISGLFFPDFAACMDEMVFFHLAQWGLAWCGRHRRKSYLYARKIIIAALT